MADVEDGEVREEGEVGEVSKAKGGASLPPALFKHTTHTRTRRVTRQAVLSAAPLDPRQRRCPSQ